MHYVSKHKIGFVKISFTGLMDLSFVWYSVTNNGPAVANDGLLENYRSNEMSSNSCNGNPTRTPPTAPPSGSGGQGRELQSTLQ
jgi:hypothetical protein